MSASQRADSILSAFASELERSDCRKLRKKASMRYLKDQAAGRHEILQPRRTLVPYLAYKLGQCRRTTAQIDWESDWASLLPLVAA